MQIRTLKLANIRITHWFTDCFVIVTRIETNCFCVRNTLFPHKKHFVSSAGQISRHVVNRTRR